MYVIINFVMHLSLLLIKTRLKSRKLIVFIHFFSFRARKQILARGCQRKFGEVKDRKSPSQPLKKKMIENEGKRLVETSEKRCRTHRGHENNHPCSNTFDPGGSHQANNTPKLMKWKFGPSPGLIAPSCKKNLLTGLQ